MFCFTQVMLEVERAEARLHIFDFLPAHLNKIIKSIQFTETFM